MSKVYSSCFFIFFEEWEVTNPTTLSIDYNQVGVLRVEQNETATALTLNNPSDTGLYYTFIVTNKSDSTEAIEVNGETIAVGQAKQFMWVGEWILGISPATTGDIYDNVNQQNLNNTLNDLQSEINGKQDTLTFDNTPTQDSTNPVTSGGVYTALSGKQDTLTTGTGITITSNTISADTPSEISYLTTAPSADNTSGNLKIVVLSSEPATKYNGYIYFIAES